MSRHKIPRRPHDGSPLQRATLTLALVAGAYSGALGCTATIDGNFGDAQPRAGVPSSTEPAGASGGGGGMGGAPSASCNHILTRRMWQLTPSELSTTVEGLVPGSGVEALGLRDSWADSQGFSNDPSLLQLSPPQVETLFQLSAHVADRFVASPPSQYACVKANPAPAGCIDSFISSFGTQAFRRGLTPDEALRYRKLYDDENVARGPLSAARQVVRAVLLSPSFLFRSELGEPTSSPGEYRLRNDEIASAISYAVLGGPPDSQLAAAASKGELTGDAQIEAQITRLVDSGAAAKGVMTFLTEHLKLTGVSDIDKQADAAPKFSAALARDMQTELDAFLHHVLWEADGTIQALLTDRSAVLSPALADLYGVPVASGGGAVELPAANRAGLLLRAGFLASFGHPDTTSPVFRGQYIRRQLLCGTIPAPPLEVDATVAAKAPPVGQTKREQLVSHKNNPSCAGCHALMDPIGLTFEKYDLLGMRRETDHGAPIDTTGRIEPGDGSGAAVDVADPIDLSGKLAQLPAVQACFARATTRYVAGLEQGALSGCSEGQALTERIKVAGGDLKKMFALALTTEIGLVRTMEIE